MNKDLFKMLQPFLLLSLLCFTKRSSTFRDESLEHDSSCGLLGFTL